MSQNGGKFERFLISFLNHVWENRNFFLRNVYEIRVDSDDQVRKIRLWALCSQISLVKGLLTYFLGCIAKDVMVK